MSIQTELTRLTNAKAAIKAAIEGKGVTVPDATLLDGMAAMIDSIEAGGGENGKYIKTGYFIPAETITTDFEINTGFVSSYSSAVESGLKAFFLYPSHYGISSDIQAGLNHGLGYLRLYASMYYNEGLALMNNTSFSTLKAYTDKSTYNATLSFNDSKEIIVKVPSAALNKESRGYYSALQAGAGYRWVAVWTDSEDKKENLVL